MIRSAGTAVRSALDRLVAMLRPRLPRTRKPTNATRHPGTRGAQVQRSESEHLEAVQTTLGLEFRERSLLREALTHRSFLNEVPDERPSNERLEYLGDAILGMIVTDFLFKRFPKLSEGELTNLRSALVRTEALAGFARDINLGSTLFVGKGEERSRGRQRPSGLACAFEALLGAIYLDQGYEASREFALRFVEPALGEVLELKLHKNGKSTLQEVVQARWQRTPSYHVIEERGPDHSKSFTVEVRVSGETLGKGIASNKRAAQQMAAQDALEKMGVTV
jgi:ribonuclease-3